MMRLMYAGFLTVRSGFPSPPPCLARLSCIPYNNSMSSALKETVVSFPSDPGVYIMKDAKGDVIYVGKAKDLRKRVSSYFLSRRDIKTSHLVGNIASIEYILTRPNTRHSSSKTTSSSSGNRVITST